MFAILGNLLRGLFGKSATRLYPLEPRKIDPAARGHIEIDIDRCIFCGICQRKCPTDAIAVVRKEKNWNIEPFRCIQCGSCVEACPKKCLAMDCRPPQVSTTLFQESRQVTVPPEGETSAEN